MKARTDHRTVLVWALGIGVGYLVLACVGLHLLDRYNAAAVIWPAAGLAVGALVVAERKAWPAIAVAVLVANFLAQILVREASFALGFTTRQELGQVLRQHSGGRLTLDAAAR